MSLTFFSRKSDGVNQLPLSCLFLSPLAHDRSEIGRQVSISIISKCGIFIFIYLPIVCTDLINTPCTTYHTPQCMNALTPPTNNVTTKNYNLTIQHPLPHLIHSVLIPYCTNPNASTMDEGWAGLGAGLGAGLDG